MYYELCPNDDDLECCIFWEDDVRGRRTIRPMYKAFACSICGKIDELLALEKAGLPEMRFSSRRDFVATGDDFKLCDQKFVEGLTSLEVRGLSFLPIAPQNGYFLLMPVSWAGVDVEQAGFEFHGDRCSKCGRFPEVSVGPLCRSIEKPSDPLVIFSPAVHSESKLGIRPLFFCSEAAMKAIASLQLKGLDMVEAL